MLWDGFPQPQIEKMLDACRVVRVARSNSRSVLGSMNDLRSQIEVHVAHDGGLANVDIAELHQRLNRTFGVPSAYRYAVEGLGDWLGQA